MGGRHPPTSGRKLSNPPLILLSPRRDGLEDPSRSLSAARIIHIECNLLWTLGCKFIEPINELAHSPDQAAPLWQAAQAQAAKAIYVSGSEYK